MKLAYYINVNRSIEMLDARSKDVSRWLGPQHVFP